MAVQFNSENLQRFLAFLMQQNLMQQRQKADVSLLEKRQQGNIGFLEQQMENQREAEELRRETAAGNEWNEWIGSVSQLPPIQNLQAIIQRKRMSGVDTTEDEKRLTSAIAEYAGPVYKTVTGEAGPESIGKILTLSDATTRTLLGQMGSSRRATQAAGLEESGQEIRKEELGVDKRIAGVREGELGLEELKESKKIPANVSEQAKMVTAAMTYLRGEGVEPVGVSVSGFLGGSAGKKLDPLSAENRGKALYTLGKLQYKLTNGQALNPTEAEFVARVYDSTRVREGGLPDPQTGLTEGEASEMQSAEALEQAIQAYMMFGGMDRKQAEIEARKLLGMDPAAPRNRTDRKMTKTSSGVITREYGGQ